MCCEAARTGVNTCKQALARAFSQKLWRNLTELPPPKGCGIGLPKSSGWPNSIACGPESAPDWSCIAAAPQASKSSWLTPEDPFFSHKDHGHWTIPKGEVDPGETDLLATAIREFEEEIGLAPPARAPFLPLGSIRQKGGKLVHAWAFPGDWPADKVVSSNVFSLEWPPGSGVMREFPEVDRAEFFDLPEARLRIKSTQIPLLDELERQLEAG